MTKRYIVQAIGLPANGLVEDQAVNVFHLDSATALSLTQMTNLESEFLGFYGTAYNGHAGGGSFLSPTMNGKWKFKWYDFDDPKPRVPLRESGESTPALDRNVSTSPREVALVVSWHAEFTSGEPKARARGRTYLGPYTGGGTTTDSLVASSLVEAAVSAATDLLDGVATITDSGHLCVHSVKDNDFKPIVGGWVDNAWDTQRRRGTKATTRTTF